MSIPGLVTVRLRLRSWRLEDIEPMAAVNGDSVSASGTIDVEETRVRLRLCEYHWEERGFGLWAMDRRRASE